MKKRSSSGRASARTKMAKRKATADRRTIAPRAMPAAFEAVRQIAHTLAGVEDGVSYGTAALKVRGALFIRLREDDDTLVLRCPIEQREALILEDPDTYFLTDHYVNYPWVLARMSAINPEARRDVVMMAYRNALADARKGRSSSKTKAR